MSLGTTSRYVVICDPVGDKIGNGGATMHALEQLQKQVPMEQLLKGDVRQCHTHARGEARRGDVCAFVFM